MSEFEKLMKGSGSKRSTIQQRNNDRKYTRKALLWVLGISFIFTIISPNIGVIIFLPTLVGVLIYGARER